MDLRSPWILFLLVLAVAPIMIHFLMRLRTKRVPWGANYLLERAIQRALKEKQWLYYLLLALRCLVAALLVFAFARPFLPGAEGLNQTAATQRQVLLINDGYNLLHSTEEGTLWEQLLRRVDMLSAVWPAGTPVSIYGLAGGLDAWQTDLRFDPSTPLSSLLRERGPRDGGVRLVPAISDLQTTYRGEEHQIWVFSPDQENQWADWERLPVATERAPVWILPGSIEGTNVRIRSTSLSSDRVLLGDSVQAVVELVADGDFSGASSVVCELVVPGQARQRERVHLLAGQPTQIRFHFPTPETAGDHRVRLEIRDADALEYDNSMELAFEVIGQMEILLPPLAGDLREFERGVDWLREWQTAAGDGAALSFRVLEGAEWLETLPPDGILWADNWAPGSPEDAALLKKWVQQGGALIVGGGPSMRPDAWDASLLAGDWQGMRLLPAGGPEFENVEAGSLEHPSLAPLQAGGASGLTPMKVYGYWEVSPGADATVAGFLQNGSPFLLRQPIGRGAVTLLTTGVSGLWNNLPVLPAFPDFLYRLAEFALVDLRPAKNFLRADGLPLVEAPGSGAKAVLTGPVSGSERETFGLARFSAAADSLWQWERLPPWNGVYEVLSPGASGAEKKQVLSALNDTRMSGEVKRLPEESLAVFEDRLGWHVLLTAGDVRRFLEGGGTGRELYSLLLLAMLLLLFSEAVVGRILAR